MHRLHTVAVTGGTGFIGAALVPALVAQGAHVRLLSRGAPTAQFPPDIRMHTGDLADIAAVSALVQGADSVLHL
ncbi:MAG: NAD-dependent epimerase/dehydratase family protein, partial [Gammaproteobacteria bacterium]|nr:NAD-dependent epimerase/dehydratase family protein [Gammaproteobacteria bacterium]